MSWTCPTCGAVSGCFSMPGITSPFPAIPAEQPEGKGASWADGVNACIAWVEKRRHDFEAEYGSIDPTTNAMEFGTVEREEYDCELAEIEEGLYKLLAAAPGAAVGVEAVNTDDTDGGIDGHWYCERHPWALQGHDGCESAGLPGCARIDMLCHIIRMRDQELRERDQQYGFLAEQALAQQPVAVAPVGVDAIDDAMVERAHQAYMATTTKPIKEALHAILTAALAGKAQEESK